MHLTLGKRTPMQDECYPMLPRKRLQVSKGAVEQKKTTAEADIQPHQSQ